MNAGKLDVLHDCRNICMCSVGDRICLTLQSMIQETVDQDRTIRCYADSRIHVLGHSGVIIDDFHAASAEYVGRANHDRIADLICNRLGFLDRCGHSGLRHRDAELIHHAAEEVAVLCEVNDLRGCSEDVNAVLLKVSCKVERRLAAELCNYADRLLLFVDAENIFKCERLEIELIGCIVVCGNCLRVAVDDDCLESELLQGLSCVYAAVVKFDTLSDSVRTATEDHDLRLVFFHRIVVRCIVCRVVVCTVLRTAYVYAVPCFFDAELDALISDIVFRNLEDLAEILIRESVPLGLCEHFVCRQAALEFKKCLLLVDEFLHLLDKIFLDLGDLMDFIDCCSLAESFIHNEVALTGRNHEFTEKLFLAQVIEVADMTETVASFFKRADCLLESFLVGLSDAHDFAYSAHLRAELVLDALEFLKCPSCEFDYDIIAVRHIFVEGAVLAARKIRERKSCSKLCGDKSNRETGRLGSKSGAAGCTRIDLNNDDSIGDRIVCELNVRAADNADVLNDLICLFLQTVHDFL